MINHIVMWKFRDVAEGANKAESLRKAKSLLDSLPLKIQLIKHYETGLDTLHTDSSYDLVLISQFADADALRAYQTHPEHVNVVEFLRKVHVSKVAVDFES